MGFKTTTAAGDTGQVDNHELCPECYAVKKTKHSDGTPIPDQAARYRHWMASINTKALMDHFSENHPTMGHDELKRKLRALTEMWTALQQRRALEHHRGAA